YGLRLHFRLHTQPCRFPINIGSTKVGRPSDTTAVASSSLYVKLLFYKVQLCDMTVHMKELLCLAIISYCISNSCAIKVSRAEIANAWQSSVYNHPECDCFIRSMDKPGQWAYFLTSDTPDPSGYQWLLLKLTRSVPVRSITVYGRQEVSHRALGIEVLLSEEKPAGLDEDAPNCTAAAFSHSLSGFQHCGFTRNDSSSSLRSHLVHEVTCSAEADGKMAQYVLLRKFVANQTDKMMNFVLLEIEKRDCFQRNRDSSSGCSPADFCKEQPRGCFVEDLSQLKLNEKVMIRARLPGNCRAPAASNCSIRMRKGSDLLELSSRAVMASSLILRTFTVRMEMHGAALKCRHSCSGGTAIGTSHTLGVQSAKPCTTHFLLPANTSWTDGAAVNLTADTPGCYWMPISHSCSVQSQRNGNTALQLLSSTNSSSTFSVTVSRSWGSSASILCRVNQSGLFDVTARRELPAVLYRSSGLSIKLPPGRIRSGREAQVTLQTLETGNPPAQHFCSIGGANLKQLRTRQSSSWNATQPLVMKEGEPVSVSVRSVGGNPEPSHRCWLRTAEGLSTSMTRAQNTPEAQNLGVETLVESEFSLSSTRQMNGGSLECRVSQHGLEDLDGRFTQNVTVY
uniref:Ig-like domain-containing protein n=1 Tax=Macrostomum lignano TaxID=282301 RepID=A0A1I8GAA5_9PLAT